ncbi:MAG: TonB-dependent receptor [Acidobacteria bacterium]|nr:TonB-dependent receptor [Acidobacteriota bacterium]
MKHRRITILNVMIFLAAFSISAAAQTATATIRGVVDDGSGKVIAGATVTLTNTSTGLARNFAVNEQGQYYFNFIEPGSYQLLIKAAGFESYLRQGLTLEVGQAAEVDVSLKPGSVTETMTVVANTQQLETGNAALGAVIDRKTIDDLPLNGRNPYQLLALSSGVNSTRASRGSNPTANGSMAISINGGRALTNEVLVDGAPVTLKADTQPALRPSPDSVQEFKVVTNSFSAEYGRTGGGALNFSTKAGTNQYRGTIYEFLRNDAMDATSFFSNRSGSGKEKLRFNQFGGNYGGPILKNKLFFFANYEGLRIRQSTLRITNVPTAKMKTGDFSDLLGATLCTNAQNQAGVCGGAFTTALNVRDTNNQQIQARAGMIYTPAATAQRRVYAGNIIPAAQLNPVGIKVLSAIPDPNRPGLTNNFVYNEPLTTNANQFVTRIDYNLSAKHQIFGRFTREMNDDTGAGQLGGSAASTTAVANSATRAVNVAIDHVYTVSPGFILHGNAGWTRGTAVRTQLSDGFDLTSLGFPSNIANASGDSKVFPSFGVTGYTTLGPLRNFGNSLNNQDTFSFVGEASMVKGAHVIKAGGTYRLYRISIFRADDPAGNFAFTRSFTARTPTDQLSGDAAASLALGIPQSGRLGIVPRLAVQNPYFGLYLQDDWNVNRRLTVNLGLRYESDLPTTERYDRLTNFGTDLLFPVAVNITFPVNLNIPARTGNPRGAIINLGRSGFRERKQSKSDLNNFAPRLGLALKLDDKTVLRAGGGIFYAPMTGGGVSTTSFGVIGDLGESAYIATLDGGITPASNLSNPFPNGIAAPTGAAAGLLTGYGRQTLTTRLAEIRNPYSGQWNLSLQRELPWRMLAEVAYTGNAGIGILGGTTDLNQLSPEALALGATVLNTQVPNPFLTLPVDQRPPAGTPLSTATLTVAQLLRPYPQYGQVQSFFANDSHSSYHALQAKLSHRLSDTLSFQGSYTFAKLIDNISAIQAAASVQTPNFQDNNNRRLDKSISTIDARHRFVGNAIYALPFGKGRRWLNNNALAGAFIGGWTTNMIVQYQGGFPLAITAVALAGQTGLAFTNLRPNLIGDPKIEGGTTEQRSDQWFNTAAFAQPASFATGSTPRTLPNVRGPAHFSVNFGIHKNFAFGEKRRLQFRAEAFNLFNRANFDNPGTTFGYRRSAPDADGAQILFLNQVVLEPL